MKADILRKSILQYAIQGKLVPQIPSEELAHILLEKIKKEKQKLIKQGKIKKEKSLTEITEDEIPFDIPENWTWVRFGDLISYNLGKTPERKNSKYWDDGVYNWVSISDLQDKQVIYSTKEKVSETASKLFSNGLSKIGTLLMSFKLTIGKVSILGCNAYHNEAIISIYPILDKDNIFRDYLYFTLCELVVLVDSTDAIKGSTLNSTKISNMLVPLPPFEEQKRIVAKIEELIAFVDKYEKYETELEKLEIEFPKRLKKSILQYAIQGKLVPQIPSEESAHILLEKIKKEKQDLIKQGKLKKEKPLTEITEDEMPFDISENWTWVRFEEVAHLITCGYASTPKYVENGMPFFSAKNVKPYKLKCDNYSKISFELYNNLTKTTLPEKRDILMTRVGAGIGEACIIDTDIKFAIYVSLTLIKLSKKLLSEQYILYWINSPDGLNKAVMNIWGKGASQGNLNVEQVRNYEIPLPPLEEQKRIVAKIEELFAFVYLLPQNKKAVENKIIVQQTAEETKIIEFPKPKFDVNDFAIAARQAADVSSNTMEKVIKQVKEHYDNKN